MQLATVGVTVHFDAAHHLPNYKGKCINMHGHTWRVGVEVTGELDPTTGFVMDLTVLKKIANQSIEQYDHQLLNHHMSVPTCEMLAHVIAVFVSTHTVKEALLAHGCKPVTITTVKVTVQEGGGGWASVTLPGVKH